MLSLPLANRLLGVFLLLAGGLLPLAGCESALSDYVTVTGKVTYDGEPLPDGMVRLTGLEIDRETGRRPVYSTRVSQGRFSVLVKPGDQVVSIEAFRQQERQLNQRQSYMGRVQYIPIRYNRRSELRMMVTGKAQQSFRFDLFSNDGSEGGYEFGDEQPTEVLIGAASPGEQ